MTRASTASPPPNRCKRRPSRSARARAMQINTGVRGVEPLIQNEQGSALPIPGDEPGGKSFGQFLSQAMGEVNQAQQHAGEMVQRMATGEKLDVHQVMIALEQASTAMSVTIQVRNKVVGACVEV